MAWSYGKNPAGSKLDAVRLVLADTQEAGALFQDEELNYFLAQNGNPDMAAALACEQLAMLYSRQVDRTMGKTSVSASQRAAAYAQRAKELKRKVLITSVGMLVGGRTYSGKAAAASDPDAIPPTFTVGHNDRSLSDALPAQRIVKSRWS
jgi:hypothetical protein